MTEEKRSEDHSYLSGAGFVPEPFTTLFCLRVFDRIMWLKPQSGTPLICPSDKVKIADLPAKCKKEWEDNDCASCAKGDKFCGPTNGCKCYYPGA